MHRAVKAGLHISFAGPLTYPISRRSRELLKKVPDARLLVETDSPYLGAQPVKHRRNEPSYLRFVAGKVAEMRRVSPRDVARITTLNAADLFDLGVGDRSPKVAYGIRSLLYVNITNRCTNSCTFCPRNWETKGAYYVKGHNLRLEREPSVEEVKDAMGDVSPYREVVFCGFGEPTIRLDVLLEVAKRIRAQGQRVRLDTNGLGSLHHGRNIVPELVEVLDSISISVNTADAEEYVRLCRPFEAEGKGGKAYRALIDFVKEARDRMPEVVVTAVEMPGVDTKAVKRLAHDLKVKYRGRAYNRVG
jgi:TatD DNase family protein